MFGFDEAQDNYKQSYDNDGQSDNQGSLTHEVIAGGAAFAGFKAFEDHQRAQGKPVSHQFAKELIAGFAGAEVDKLAETKGEDFIDRERAKRDASARGGELYDQHYGGQGDQYDPNSMNAPDHFQNTFGDGGDGRYGNDGGNRRRDDY